jgi:wyosine [tRNA(Phe)-imidazoG37] synthetase (radical SAM superfamily)
VLQLLQEELVQGPAVHPRYGRTIVVRPTCQGMRAGRFPTQAVVVTNVARKVIEIQRSGEKIQALLVEGEKDPTLHPEFHEISENLRELLKKWFPKAQLILHAQQPELSTARARHALSFYDKPVLRLEAGTQKTVAAITGDASRAIKDTLDHMGRLEIDRLILQTRFVRGEIDNSSENEVRAWLKNLADIKPASVQIITPPRPKAKERPVPKSRMEEIAELVTEKTGIPVEVCLT